jgi:hypothetical protein
LKKQILMLSVAAAACLGAPALADPYPIDDITTILTAPITTATANSDGTPADIKIDTGGGITVTTGGAAVTINSNNSFDQIAGTTISNKGTDAAVGILVDLTTQNLDATNDPTACPAGDCHVVEGILENGTIDLSGTGSGKRGVWLQGADPLGGTDPLAFTGNIDMSNSTMTITGDNSVGVLLDQLTILNGNLILGNMNMQPTSTTGSVAGVIGLQTSGTVNGDIDVGLITDTTTATATLNLVGSTLTTAAGTIGLDLGGTINGNVLIDAGSKILTYGTGAQGILLTGNINACNQTVAPDCTSLGALINNGIIATAGTPTPGPNPTGNPTSGTALAIGGSIAGGIFNNGPISVDDSKNITAVIAAQSFAPVIEITPGFQTTVDPTPIVIGVYADATDPGFSFYNRGSIQAASSNIDQNTAAIFIVGDGPTATATLTGGLFNSGTISANVTTDSKATGASNATAITIGAGAYVGFDPTTGLGDTYHFDSGCSCMVWDGTDVNKLLSQDQAALVNSNESHNGKIFASVSGPFSGNNAIAININALGTLPSIINQGVIEAVATSADTTITGLSATAIKDASGTLTYIQNNGTIEAIASKLDDGSQSAVAIDLSLDAGGAAQNGVEILNQATADSTATILGDIKFGEGDNQIVDVFGATTDHTATILGDIHFGGGGVFGSDQLNIGNFATVVGAVTAENGVSVDVQQGGTFIITNDAKSGELVAKTFHVETGGELDVTVFEEFNTGVVDASQDPGGFVHFDPGAKLNITYGSFVPSNSDFVLFTAGKNADQMVISDIDAYNAQLTNELPFLFKDATLNIVQNSDLLTQSLVLHVDVKDAAELGLTGYAVQMLPLANQALINDDPLGAAMVAGVVDQKSAQNAYDQFAPEVTGGARAIAMSLTDQATGPVASRQRILRMYGKAEGEVTLWGQEFAEFIKDPGNTDTGQTGFKDHGFGFVLGMDGGSPKIGWYGGAFTFYSGDIVEALPRNSHTNTLWYMLSGYTDWRGRGLFLDTKFDVGYVNLKSKRYINLTIPGKNGAPSTQFIDEADGNRPGLVGSAGFTTGVILAYGATTITPQVSVDAMTMREEGYSEAHPTASPGNGDGFNLTTQSYYANSLRAFIGADVREDLDMGDFFVQPDVRLGYRYDFLNDPTKLKAQFSNVPVNGIDQPGPLFTVVGPDPSQGNFVAGASISATTDAWTLGANFDFVRGTNGATTEVGMLHLLGRI